MKRREKLRHERYERRIAHVAGKEREYIVTITATLGQYPMLRALFKGRPTQAEVAELLAHDAQRSGHTFNEAIAHVAFSLMGMTPL